MIVTKWRTVGRGGSGTLGMVASKAPEGRWVAHLGICANVEQEVDAVHIMQHGAKLNEPEARAFFPELAAMVYDGVADHYASVGLMGGVHHAVSRYATFKPERILVIAEGPTLTGERVCHRSVWKVPESTAAFESDAETMAYLMQVQDGIDPEWKAAAKLSERMDEAFERTGHIDEDQRDPKDR